MKTCKRCCERKERDQFDKHQGSIDGRRGVCKACRLARKREVYASDHPEMVKRPESKPEPETYFCAICGTTKVSKRDGRCFPCAMAMRRLDRTQGDEAKPQKTALQDSSELRAKGTKRWKTAPERMMEIAPDEFLKLDARCRGCGKWVLASTSSSSTPTRCFSCATGRPRTVLRAAERRQAAA